MKTGPEHNQLQLNVGARIRERRLLERVKQADLARSVGISPAYLNLIEHNKRRIGGKLLADIARALSMDLTALTQGVDVPLLESLREAADPSHHSGLGAEIETDRAGEFIGRFPGWAGLVAAQAERISGLEGRIDALNDRLSHDPFLASSLHDVLSAVTAIRSTAGILNSGDEIDPDWSARFHRNIYEDSQRLAESAQSLVNYLDTVGEADAAQGVPLDELEAWVAATPIDADLEETEAASLTDTPVTAPALTSPAAQHAATQWQARARQDARLMSAALVQDVLQASGPDPAKLSELSGGSFAAAMRSLASFRLPADLEHGPAAAPEIGLLMCDGSGALTFRKPLDGFAPPRVGAACPLWPLYQALLHPMKPIRHVIQQSGVSARSYLSYAIAEPVQRLGFEGPQVFEATMMFVALDAVSDHVSGGLESSAAGVIEVGTSCRVCARQACPARREPSLIEA